MVAKMINIERFGVDFERIFKSTPIVWVWCGGNWFSPLFFLKYRRVAKMINIEHLGWILNVLFKSTLSALVRGGGIVIHLERRQNTLGRLR